MIWSHLLLLSWYTTSSSGFTSGLKRKHGVLICRGGSSGDDLEAMGGSVVGVAVEKARSLVAEGEAERAFEVLLVARSSDARRMDMVPELYRAFAETLTAMGELDALAALHADHEAWTEVIAACAAAPGPPTPRRRALALRARRSCWDWLPGDGAEARDLVDLDAVGAFAALSLPSVSVSSCARRGARAVAQARERAATAPTATTATKTSARSGGTQRDESLPWLAVLTPDANGAHPLSQLLPSALGHISKYRVALVTMCASDGSEERSRFEASADLVIDPAGAAPAEVAAYIKDEIKAQILVDMCGHAGSSDVLEVCAHRPAPLILGGGLGTPAQMGCGVTYDYTVCDAVVAPIEPCSFSEKWLRMPETYFVGDVAAYESYSPQDEAAPARGEYGLREGAVVLACMNRPHKYDRRQLETWIRIVGELADAQLWLLQPSEAGRERALQIASGILPGGRAEAESRLVFCANAPKRDHLRRLRCADIALDTLAYGSHTLACDCAWANLPLVTALCATNDGDAKWADRVGASATLAAFKTSVERSTYKKACVAEDWGESYARLAVNLGRDPELRATIRDALGRGVIQGAALWNPARWADGFERSLAAAEAASVVDAPPRLKSCFALVLGSSAERVRHFETTIKAALPEIARVAAVEGSDRESVKKALGSLTVATDVWTEATSAQVACAASHTSLWRHRLPDSEYSVILEDDATFPAGAESFRRRASEVIESLENEDCDLCYLYVYPDHWPTPPLALDDQRAVKTRGGFRTWCLLAYVVTPKGAAKLRRLLDDELPELYAPIDCVVADWAARGLLKIRAVDTVGFVDNQGQLDRRKVVKGKLRSNIWNSPPWDSKEHGGGDDVPEPSLP